MMMALPEEASPPRAARRSATRSLIGSMGHFDIYRTSPPLMLRRLAADAALTGAGDDCRYMLADRAADARSHACRRHARMSRDG